VDLLIKQLYWIYPTKSLHTENIEATKKPAAAAAAAAGIYKRCGLALVHTVIRFHITSRVDSVLVAGVPT